jgi:hypothetical protein
VDFGQVGNECLGSSADVLAVETEWKLPSLHLTATTGVVFTGSEPMVWFIKLDVCEERNLIYWGLGQSFNSNLFIGTVDFESKGLSDIACVGPNELLLGVTSVSDSSMSWR